MLQTNVGIKSSCTVLKTEIHFMGGGGAELSRAYFDRVVKMSETHVH